MPYEQEPIMRPLERQHFERSLEAFRERDPELYEELKEKVDIPADEMSPMMIRAIRPLADEPLITEEGIATPQGFLVAETIVRSSGRPVLVIRDNRVTTEFLGPDSQVWAARIQGAQPVLDRVIPAVGRVEVNNNPDFSWVGTGWLVSSDIIVTNRHVAREFARRNANTFSFRLGINGSPMTARMDFLEEDQRQTSLEYAVNSILWIAPSSEADVAFLRVTRGSGNRSLPLPLTFADQINRDDFVATIGYPARDSRVPDQDIVRRIFGDVYEKKRLAPGQVMEVDSSELQHDCSTLGGNSGSVLVNLETGEAVGLHFSGLFMRANYAVPAPKVRDLLRRVQLGELPSAININTGTATANSGTPAVQTPGVLPPAVSQGTYTFQFQIPVEVTIKVGEAIFSGSAPVALNPVALNKSVETGKSFEDALQIARQTLANNPDIIEIRPGYRFKRGWITDERVIVVEMREKLSMTELHNAGKPPIPPQISGIGVDVRTAALSAQLENIGIIRTLEAEARPGGYREPPDLSLPLIRERMKAIFHVSPDSGFPNLKEFLSRVEHKLTATMYEWEPNHISDAIVAAITPQGKLLKMVTQKAGTRSAIDDLKNRLAEDKFEHVWASVGSGKLIPRAYHIKVASRDGKEVWLSSGNWKDSNQADIDPSGTHSTVITPLRRHNREWHVIIENARLAQLFQKYIEFDFSEAQRVPIAERPEREAVMRDAEEEPLIGEGVEIALAELFVPEAAFRETLERRAAVQYFAPLVLDRELEIQPLLTPDRDGRGNRIFMAYATEMISKARRKIYIENQSFNLLGDDDNDEFENFFNVLKSKQDAGLEIRIIFRDAREFGRQGLVDQQRLLERIKDFGLDTSSDVIRVQQKCHTKGIIVDSLEVLFGSHNLTNQGSLFNRDASLLVRDAEVAAYFERIFNFDWEVLARQEIDELIGGLRIANPGEETPAGFRRISLAEIFDGD
jgi:S1-C subfamily serine protease